MRTVPCSSCDDNGLGSEWEFVLAQVIDTQPSVHMPVLAFALFHSSVLWQDPKNSAVLVLTSLRYAAAQGTGTFVGEGIVLQTSGGGSNCRQSVRAHHSRED